MLAHYDAPNLANVMQKPTRHYASYLLRVWQSASEETSGWRYSLEDLTTRQRFGFADLESLYAFLERAGATASLHPPGRDEQSGGNPI